MSMLPAPIIPIASPGRRLRMAVVTETYLPEINGVAMTVERMVGGLLARGHAVQLVRPCQVQTDVPRREGTLEILPLPSLAIPFYPDARLGLPAGRALRRRWIEAPPDLVHIVTEGPLGYSALNVARRLGLPVLFGFHTNFHSYSGHYRLGWLRAPILAYLRRFHNRCACTLVPTAELTEELRRLGFHNTRLLPRGVDTWLFSPTRRSFALREVWGARPEDPVVLYVGRLAAEKNLGLAVAAFHAIRRECPAASFVLVGDGPLGSKLRARYPEFVLCGMRRGEDLATLALQF